MRGQVIINSLQFIIVVASFAVPVLSIMNYELFSLRCNYEL